MSAPAKSEDPITIRPTPTAMASATRVHDSDRTQRGNPIATPTTAGTIVSCASTLLKNRWFQTVQYGSPRNHVTAAASRKPEIIDATVNAAKNVDSRRGVSKRGGASLNSQMAPAERTASRQLVKYRDNTSAAGHPVGSWTTKWTGRTGSSTSHHRRGGTRRRIAVTMAFGGQMTDGVAGGMRSSRPRTLPK